ncbi:MOSC N-terminal beta barrel domain-containing protein [Alcaligenes phenolicus]|uniref:MOSC domain-containing protein n=1 Tax=Alcaligenes phenolicus TaxID=232846 RepID=UPI002AA75D49|nr:MOSC N-terminal beta barrel domain-containing protein [Alcaligenes phenolicus]
MITITGLFTHPIKSCAAQAHPQGVEVSVAGLAFDREWVVVDQQGVFMTQRRWPRMALIQPVVQDGQITVQAPGMDPLSWSLDAPAGDNVAVSVRIWSSDTLGRDEGDQVAQWFSDFLQTPCRVLRNHSRARRYVLTERVRPWEEKSQGWRQIGDQLNGFGFADALPFLFTNEASLEELNRLVQQSGEQAVPMDRFRANVVFKGLPAYEEDYVLGVSSEGLSFAFIRPCTRCPMPNVNQLTGDVGTQPGLALAQSRQFPQGTLFGMQAMLVESKPQRLSIGQTLDVEYSF